MRGAVSDAVGADFFALVRAEASLSYEPDVDVRLEDLLEADRSPLGAASSDFVRLERRDVRSADLAFSGGEILLSAASRSA